MNWDGRRHVIVLVGLGVALVLSGLLVLLGLSADQVRADAALDVVAVDAILAQPRRYLGREVILRGEVARMWGNNVMALRSRRLRQGLLVVITDAGVQDGGSYKGQVVEVRGRVLPFCRQELLGLRQLGVELKDDLLRAINGRDPYLVAEEVRLVDAPR